MATIPTPEQGKPVLDFSAGTFDGNSNLFQSRNGATEHVNGDDVADYVNTSRIYNGLETASKTPVGAINEVNRKDASDIAYDNTSSGLTATDVQGAIDEMSEKIEAIGEITEHDSPSVSVSSGTFATLESFSVPKGTYIIITTFNQADSNQQGFRIGLIDRTETSANTSINSILATGRATIQKTRVFVIPSTTTIYIRAYQNSGSAINMNSHTEIVRIK